MRQAWRVLAVGVPAAHAAYAAAGPQRSLSTFVPRGSKLLECLRSIPTKINGIESSNLKRVVGSAAAAGGVGDASGGSGQDKSIPPPKLSARTMAALVAAQAAVVGAATALTATVKTSAPAAAVSSAMTCREKITPQTAGEACDKVVASSAATSFRSYRQARLYTMEFRPPYEGAPKMVLLHGYGSGSGLWLTNVDALAAHYHVYAVDWLGCGASDRPPFAASTVGEGERWFTESLEAWRAAQGIDRAVFVGHSLGGYLSSAYALHHPHRVDHLVLVSPAGIPTPPSPERLAQQRSHWLLGMIAYAWESGVTPQSIVRALGPLGEKWTGDIINRRFAHVGGGGGGGASAAAAASAAGGAASPPWDRDAFVRYLYQITAADGSGEFALNVLLSFGAHARQPMGPRLLAAAEVGEVPEPVEVEMDKALAKTAAAAAAGASSAAAGASSAAPPTAAGAAGTGGEAAPRHRFTTPTTFLYGTPYDWMDARAGAATAAGLRERGVDAACLLVQNAGHHLYLEQPEQFAKGVLGRLQPQRRR